MKPKIIATSILTLWLNLVAFGQEQAQLTNNLVSVYNAIDVTNKNVYLVSSYASLDIGSCFKNVPAERRQKLERIIEFDSMALQALDIKSLTEKLGTSRCVSSENAMTDIPLLYKPEELSFEKEYNTKIDDFYRNVFKLSEDDNILETISNEIQSSSLERYVKIKANQFRKKSMTLLSVYEGKKYLLVIYKIHVVPSVDEQNIVSELILK